MAKKYRRYADIDVEETGRFCPVVVASTYVEIGVGNQGRDDDVEVHNGIIQISVNTPAEKLTGLLANARFEQVFLVCRDWEERDAVLDAANRVVAVLNENHIVKYEPVIVSIASVPPEERNRIVEFFTAHHIPSVALTFERYAALAGA